MMSAANGFLSGVATMGFFIATLFFVRFWRRTKEKLFLAFGCSFFLFSVNQMLVAFANLPKEDESLFYLLRLAGFLILIAAIVAQNLKAKNQTPGNKSKA
jgi:uncharacterized membrane protein